MMLAKQYEREIQNGKQSYLVAKFRGKEIARTKVDNPIVNGGYNTELAARFYEQVANDQKLDYKNFLNIEYYVDFILQ